jgi:TRAP-type mannitol/chloroaromatic compound transport system substrate-binding protein
MKRRDFIKKAGIGTAAAVAATAVKAPYVIAKKKIRWRMQTYAGAALAEHVIKPSIDAFNAAANGEMIIDLYNADQLVPQGELFRALQEGTIDAVQSDDDSIAAPVDVSIFGAYFPFASRYFLDIPALFHWYGLDKIWQEAYAEIPEVTWLSSGSWDPCNFASVKPIRSVEDLKGMRMYISPRLAGSCNDSALFRWPFPMKMFRWPFKRVNWTAWPGPASPRIIPSAGRMSPNII